MAENILTPPDEYLCPITHELMENPVVAADGFTYERSAITLWLQKGHHSSPMTNDRLPHNSLTPNLILKRMIDKFRGELPLVQRENKVKANIEAAIKFKEEVMKQAIEINNRQIHYIEGTLAEERAKMERLVSEIEEIKQRIPGIPAESKNPALKKKIKLPAKANQNSNSRVSLGKSNIQPKALNKVKSSNYSVIFKLLTGKNFTLQVNDSDTVAKIKDKIFQQEDIPQAQQKLIFEGRKWTDEELMSDTNITKNNIVYLVLRTEKKSCENRQPDRQPQPRQPQPRPRRDYQQPEDYLIYVKTLTGAKIEFNVNSNDTVENLKMKIQEHEGMPHEQQRLIFEGCQMGEDDWTLADYDLYNECTVHLVLRLKGC